MRSGAGSKRSRSDDSRCTNRRALPASWNQRGVVCRPGFQIIRRTYSSKPPRVRTVCGSVTDRRLPAEIFQQYMPVFKSVVERLHRQPFVEAVGDVIAVFSAIPSPHTDRCTGEASARTPQAIGPLPPVAIVRPTSRCTLLQPSSSASPVTTQFASRLAPFGPTP